MIASPDCPVCEQHDWETLAERVYRAADRDAADNYMAPRYDVMFQLWWPDRTEVRITYVLCRRCGFVMYTPRPSDGDIAAKYAFLVERGEAVGHAHSDAATDDARAAAVHRQMAPLLPPGSARVLDLGGGDGRMLRPFLEAGHQGCVVDYNPRPIAGVERLGATLDEVPESERFDAAISLHVLEHLADPLRVVRQIARRLRPEGVLFVEVPLEVWRLRPDHLEPVTHVNYFTRDSLNVLLRRGGFGAVQVWEQVATAPGGGPIFVVRAAARTAAMAEALAVPPDPAHTRRLLHPSRWDRALWMARHPRFYMRPELLRRKAARLLGGA